MCGFYHSFNVQVKNKVSKLLKSTIYSFKGKLIQFSLMVITISYKSLLSTCTPLQFDFKFVLGHKTYFFVTLCVVILIIKMYSNVHMYICIYYTLEYQLTVMMSLPFRPTNLSYIWENVWNERHMKEFM